MLTEVCDKMSVSLTAVGLECSHTGCNVVRETHRRQGEAMIALICSQNDGLVGGNPLLDIRPLASDLDHGVYGLSPGHHGRNRIIAKFLQIVLVRRRGICNHGG